MARMARVVAPGIPHHVTQRGNQQQEVFTCDDERRMYLRLLKSYSEEHKLAILGYCLMGNHVHLLLVPPHRDSLARCLGTAHMDYSRWVLVRRGTKGHLWQNRFYSCPVDGPRLWGTLRYVECNPVRAALVRQAELWLWSSARAHLAGQDDTGLLDMKPWRAAFTPQEWRAVLESGEDPEESEQLRRSTRTGRPLGGAEFVEELERRLGRMLRPRRPGPKPKTLDSGQGTLPFDQAGAGLGVEQPVPELGYHWVVTSTRARVPGAQCTSRMPSS